MTLHTGKPIVVLGATGRVGGAATRHLLNAGWPVRAITRDSGSRAALALQNAGAELLQGDMEKPATLKPAFNGAYGVVLVVNGWLSTFEAEVQQGKHIADLAAEAGISHLVFPAAGTGEPGTGLPHFESKLEIEAYLHAKDVPHTVIFPPSFMEMMIDPDFYPQFGTWGCQRRLLGDHKPIPWIASDDLGKLIAVILNSPDAFIGKRLKPVGVWKTLGECRAIYKRVLGRQPASWPMPVWLLEKMQPELVKMWRWMRETDALDATKMVSITSWLSNVTDVSDFLVGSVDQPERSI